MLKIVHIILTMSLVTMFSTTKLPAEANFSQASLVIDQSESMFDSKHIEIVRDALITALTNFVIDCNNVQFDYVAWGGTVLSTISVKLTSQVALDDYTVKLYETSHARLGSTIHSLGVSAAVKQLNISRAHNKVMIFITDGVSVNKRDLLLGQTIPSDIKVFTISLGRVEVSQFVQKNIMPASGGVHYHANNADELQLKIEEVFKTAKTDMCVS